MQRSTSSAPSPWSRDRWTESTHPWTLEIPTHSYTWSKLRIRTHTWASLRCSWKESLQHACKYRGFKSRCKMCRNSLAARRKRSWTSPALSNCSNPTQMRKKKTQQTSRTSWKTFIPASTMFWIWEEASSRPRWLRISPPFSLLTTESWCNSKTKYINSKIKWAPCNSKRRIWLLVGSVSPKIR